MTADPPIRRKRAGSCDGTLTGLVALTACPGGRPSCQARRAGRGQPRPRLPGRPPRPAGRRGRRHVQRRHQPPDQRDQGRRPCHQRDHPRRPPGPGPHPGRQPVRDRLGGDVPLGDRLRRQLGADQGADPPRRGQPRRRRPRPRLARVPGVFRRQPGQPGMHPPEPAAVGRIWATTTSTCPTAGMCWSSTATAAGPAGTPGMSRRRPAGGARPSSPGWASPSSAATAASTAARSAPSPSGTTSAGGRGSSPMTRQPTSSG